MNDQGEGGEFVGYVYVDPFPRDGKYGHVAHHGLQSQFTKPDGERHYPASALLLKYPPPTSSSPCLLKYEEVISCSHKLDPAIHWLVSRTACSRFDGTLVPRDFVEVPPRMLEHLFWDPNVTRAVLCHYAEPELDKRVPEKIVINLMASRYNNVISRNLGSLMLAVFDREIHRGWDSNATEENQGKPAESFKKPRREISLMRSVEEFGMGYATFT
ncbi:peptidase M3A/M3B [Xylariales sp. AK1849]|nr:peptidase M3A/M3B [Xylariales sp. AK1849]